MVKNRKTRTAGVIEAKWVEKEEQLENACKEALAQIEEKGYAKKLERAGFRIVIRYGIAFYKKTRTPIGSGITPRPTGVFLCLETEIRRANK